MGKRPTTDRVPVSCPLDCGGGCPLLAHVRGGRITRITVNPAGGPFLEGCIKGFRAAETVEAPDRLLWPLIRTGPRGSGRFRRAGWDEALDLGARRLGGLRQQHGPESVLNLGGSGSWRGALHSTTRLARRFFSHFGGCTWKEGSYSSQAFAFTAPFVLGTDKAGSDPATVESSRLVVLWGANPAEARMGPEWLPRLRRAKRNGAEIVVIDPRRTATVKALKAEWLPVRPGSDAALMLAVLHVLISENLADADFVGRYGTGFGDLADRVMGRSGRPAATPNWASPICGLPPETIAGLARRLGGLKPAALIPGLSIQRTIGGEEAVRLAIAIQAVTGNLGRPGGWAGVYPYNTLDSPRVGTLPAPPNPPGPSVPVYLWAEAVLKGRAGDFPSDIRAIYNLGSNYLAQGSDLAKNIRAFSKIDFSVCHDFFLTPTAKYCDIVFPAATFLERTDIVLPAGGGYLLYSRRAVPPRGEVRTDYDILSGLAERLGFGEAFTEGRTEADWLELFIADSDIEDAAAFTKTGLFQAPVPDRVGLADFIADPETHPLATPSGRIELAPAAYAATGFPAVPEHRGPGDDPDYPFRLVTPKIHERIHSQGFTLAWTKARERYRLWLNPRDAAGLGVVDGQPVMVESRQGRVKIPALVTYDIRPGTVCLIEGAWPEFGPDEVETAGSANVLTSTRPTRPSQGSRTHSTAVRVRAWPE